MLLKRSNLAAVAISMFFAFGATAAFNAMASVAEKAPAAESTEQDSASQDPTLAPPPPIIIQVTGYAFYEPVDANKPDPKRLLAIRASRLDAYRNLAERVYGISVSSSSTVKDFSLANDEFAVHFESVVRGARVVSISENQQTGIETVLELSLPGNFADCLNKTNSFKATQECVQPMPSISGVGSQASSREPMSKQYYLH